VLISGRTILDARAATASDFSWASVISGELPPTPTPPAQPPASAPEAQIVPEAIAQAVRTVVPSPDVTVDKPDTALRYMRRRLKDADVYLFFNEGPDASSHTVTLRSDGLRVELWDPQTGKIAPLNAAKAKNALTVQLAIGAYETKVLVVR
jgi:hypothetical protein